MKARLAKICPLLSFAVYGVLLLILNIYLVFFAFEGSLSIFLFRSLGWIPSLIFSVLGIVFSALSLKDGGAKIFLILSCVNAVISALWGCLALEFVLGYDNVYMY